MQISDLSPRECQETAHHFNNVDSSSFDSEDARVRDDEPIKNLPETRTNVLKNNFQRAREADQQIIVRKKVRKGAKNVVSRL